MPNRCALTLYPSPRLPHPRPSPIGSGAICAASPIHRLEGRFVSRFATFIGLEPGMPEMKPLLAARDLNAWYGESHILHGVEFDVTAGEVVTLLGRNGAGKTTTLKSIMAIVPRREGSIVFEDQETIRLASNRIARMGIAYCPEERGIFSSLNVE